MMIEGTHVILRWSLNVSHRQVVKPQYKSLESVGMNSQLTANISLHKIIFCDYPPFNSTHALYLQTKRHQFIPFRVATLFPMSQGHRGGTTLNNHFGLACITLVSNKFYLDEDLYGSDIISGENENASRN